MPALDFGELAETVADLIAVFDRDHRYLFVNAALEREMGMQASRLLGVRNDEVMPPDDAALWRDAIDHVLATGSAREIECTIATPRGVRTYAAVLTPLGAGRVCSVARDITDVRSALDARRAGAAASYLAAAGEVLERFDPETSLQAIIDLAVPAHADWCFVHMRRDTGIAVVALAHADPKRLAEARELAARVTVPANSGVARVLRGGPAELVELDDGILSRLDASDEHRAWLRATGYRSAVVAPLTGREGILGALTFAMAASGRRYQQHDLDALSELARRTGIALENARLFAAEQQARKNAEAARDRTRQLQRLTAALSATLERDKVIAIVVDAGCGALGAAVGHAWQLRDDGETVELTAAHDDGRSDRVDHFRSFKMSTPLPASDVIRSGQPMLFETFEAMARRYPVVADRGSSPFNAWAVIPFVVRGRAIGVASFSFEEPHEFSAEDREFLTAIMGQAELALERCDLLESERRAREEVERARLRERQLHVLAAKLSSALTQTQIATIVSNEMLSILGAVTSGAALCSGDHIEIIGAAGSPNRDAVKRYAKAPLTARIVQADAVREQRIVWCSNELQLAAQYGHLEYAWRGKLCSWGGVPFTFEGRTSGALMMGFANERELSTEDREFLTTVGQLTAQALERARLSAAHQSSDDQLRLALTAARAATWSLDIKTMQTQRDDSYRRLVGLEAANSSADFSSIHPDDRAIARLAFERALRDGVPYEPEVRVQRDDGTYMWIRSHARVLYNADGTPASLAGVIVDIDEAKQASMRADTLHRLAATFASELDQDRLVHMILAELSKLTGAQLATFTFASGRSAITLGDASVAGTAASSIALPIAVQASEPLGTLLLAHAQPSYFTNEHARLASGVASHAAVALENARLYNMVVEQKQQLEDAVERARLADRRKDEFLAMLSHELRNPLAPIATALDLMDLKDSVELRKERDVIRRQVTHMSRLIDDLLDVSRITRGKIQLERKLVEISAVLAKAIETASPLLEKRMQRLSISVPHTGLLVDADPTRLAQVFQNLVTNAAKYSEPKSLVELRARREGEQIVVEVHDDGMGIAPELLPRLFELFVQGERTIDRAEGGLGIGLTIAKSLCELHGGTIDVRSEGAGKGSTFIVTLPRAVEVRAPISPSGRATERMAALPTGTRVLVVDDNIDAAEMLRAFLEALGHEPAVAHDGPAALELATTFKPDIAVLDIGLPVMNGYELAERLRATLGSEKLRLIAVTGYGQDADRARAREAGFEHHLIKPVELDALLSLLGKTA